MGIVAGPDGGLWFTERLGRIGRITTTGSLTEYRGVGVNGLNGIAVGPFQSALWFTSSGINAIDSISLTGSITPHTGPGIVRPTAIASQPDGAMWFTRGVTTADANDTGRITNTGTVSTDTAPGVESPVAIAAGPEGGNVVHQLGWHHRPNQRQLPLTPDPPLRRPTSRAGATSRSPPRFHSQISGLQLRVA